MTIKRLISIAFLTSIFGGGILFISIHLITGNKELSYLTKLYYELLEYLIPCSVLFLWFSGTACIFYRCNKVLKNLPLRLLAIFATLFLSSFPTIHLLKIAQINGYLWGPASELKTVTDRAPLSTCDLWGPEGGLAWGPHDDWRKGEENVIFVSSKKYESVALGDEIRIVRFSNDPLPHTPGENYVSVKHSALQTIFLMPLLLGAAYLVWHIKNPIGP